MGDIVPIKPARCPCGWRMPKNVAVELIGPAYRLIESIGLSATIHFNCPQCNCRLELGKSGGKVSKQ